MPRKARDYRAEYKRRVALAQQRGHRNYYEQRRKIETGETPALQPARLRRRDVIEKQQRFERLLPDWLTVNVQDARIDMAQNWSDWYSRHWSTRFDADRARNDPHYLNVYMQAFVMQISSGPASHRLTFDEYRREWFVNIMEYFSVEEYDDRYLNV
jgi:hypothetical protein